MSQLLINTVSLISRLSGCLVYSHPTRISFPSRVLYPLNVVQTVQIIVLFVSHVTLEKPFLFIDFEKYSIVLNMLDRNSDVIIVIKYVTTFFCHLMTLVGSFRRRNLVAKSIEEAKAISNIHHVSCSVLSWKYCYQISIYPALILLRLSIIASTDFFQNTNWISMIFVQCFIVWAQMATICTEGQFAVLVSIVEKELEDINKRIEVLAESAELGGDGNGSNCHLGYNYPHPFFQYQEIIPSLGINIRSSLINFQLNKSNFNRGTTRVVGVADYEQYSDSMGGLNCQLLPLGKEIRSRDYEEEEGGEGRREGGGVLEPFQSLNVDPGASGAFKAIEEEKQPARNQFATESKPAASPPFHLLNLRSRLRLLGKISPPKTKLRGMKSTRITVNPKDRNPHLERVESPKKRNEIKELTKLYSRVARLAVDLSTSFEPQLASSQIFVRVNCPINLYLLIEYLKSSEEISYSIILKLTAIVAHHLLRIFVLCESAERAIFQDKKTEHNLLALSRTRMCPRLVDEVSFFNFYLSSNSPNPAAELCGKKPNTVDSPNN